nr:hypothetical protein BaRGS_010940 [Batillaria attramentaria]
MAVQVRAAAKAHSNPQRLWSEEPDWWKECTQLLWKNPREHPKDKKEILKKKIEILEKQLRERGLMTSAIEQELELSKSSKKADLELKSDFEAVIAKASGLHYMVDQVYAKMEKTRVFSDKIADYILEIKSCLDMCVSRMEQMHEKVDAREKRKKALWEHFGVSKTKRTRISEEEPAFLELDFLQEDLSPILDSVPSPVLDIQYFCG